MKQGWTYKQLGEIATFIKDGDWIESKDQSESGIRLIQTGNVGYGVFKIKDDKPHYITEDTMVRLGCTEIFEGDCLVSRLPNPVGRACLIPDIGCRMITAVDCSIIRFGKDYLPQFFIYYTQSYKYLNSIDEKTTGTTRKRISRKNLEKIQIPMPPLSEQERIVERLDAAFAQIDELKSNAEWQLAEARALFQSALTQAMQPKPGWQEKPLNAISHYSIGLTYKPADVAENGTIVLRSSNIQNDRIDLTDLVRVSCPIKESLLVEEGDILMCSRNGSARLVGKVAMIPKTIERMTYGTFMMVIKSEYNPYLLYFFKSDSFRNQIKHGEANMINQITRYMLDDVIVNVPPIIEQNNVVAHLDALSNHVKDLEEISRKTAAECDALKQALLRQIFE